MIQTAPPKNPIRQSRSEVPEELRGQVLIIHFASAVPRFIAEWFYHVRLGPAHFRDCEDRFHQADRFQPTAVADQMCPNCGMPMQRLGEMESACMNSRCVLPSGREGRDVRFVTGPKRGVVKVLIADDFVVGGYGGRGELIDRCALVLDRRYNDAVCRALYRLAGEVCEIVREETDVNLRLR